MTPDAELLIVNPMVNYRDPLDVAFSALADPTRRGILAQLAEGQEKVTELARPYNMSLPAISKHLRILERAGLITRTRVGREHRIRIDPKPIREAMDWMAMYAQAWEHQFNALDDYLKHVKREHDQEEDA